MSDTPQPVESVKQSRTSRITIPKDKIKDLTVDKPVTLNISGKVKSIVPCYSDEDLYDIEIDNPLVEKVETADIPDDSEKDLSSMKLGDLKNMISKASEPKDNYNGNK